MRRRVMLETLIVSAILLLALVLFVTELVPIDLTALLIVGLLVLTGVLTPAEGFSGFSHPAPVTVAAMLVLSAGLIRTGAVARLGQKVSALGGSSEVSHLAVIFPVVALLSAFISNTAAVAMFIPLVLNIAREKNLSPSKMLLPLSYAAILGGACTYIGTSTNIIVGTIYAAGTRPPLQMFEFTGLGLVLLGLGAVYMLVIGQRKLPSRPTEASLTEGYRLREYLTELVIRADSPLLDRTLKETNFSQQMDIEVLEIQRAQHKLRLFLQDIRLRGGDVLIVKGNLENILKIRDTEGVDILAEVKLSDRDLKSEDITLAEAVISPDSFLIGRTLKEANFRQRYQATALAIRRHGSQIRDKLGRVRLQVGDMLLVQVRKVVLGNLRQDSDFMLILEESQGSDFRFSKLPVAALIFLGVIVAAASRQLSIELAALFGAMSMVLTRCITLRQAYLAVDWRIVILIGGTLALGTAMEKTGTANLIAENLVGWSGPLGPVALIAVLYLLTLGMTELMSNNATAALLTPIAISIAHQGGWDPRPFAFCVAFAASCSFLTPIGYQTNTMVYGPGGYRFTDFFKVGVWLSLISWLTATLLIPRIWPFN
ncbi:MAG: SLC13 family permease [Acidobacteria bacterium]|nr:SLC13 family permease [Acidobacteriota bacterium]